MPDNPTEIARASYLAYAAADRPAFAALLADDFRFTSPLDFELDTAGYFERCWPDRAPRPAPDFIRLESVGDTVFVTYEDKKPNGTRIRNTEILTIRDGRIARTEVYFGWDVPAT